MIRWIRDKFRGALSKKARKVERRILETDREIAILNRRRSKLLAQRKLLSLLGIRG